MPQLPYQSSVMLSESGQQPNAQATPVSNAIGQGLTNLAGGMKDAQDAWIQQQQLHDAAAVNDLYATKYSPAMRKLMYDPQSGYFTKQGADAVSALPQVQDMAEALRTQARGALQNENQQRMFDAMARRHTEIELDGAARHADRENQVWQAQTSDAVVKDKVASSVDHFNDPKFVEGAIAGGLQEIQGYGTTHGQSAEQMAQRATEFVRGTRTAVLQRMLVDDPMAAKEYLKTHAAELAGPNMAVLAHQVKSAVLPIEARNIADRVIATGAAPAPAVAAPGESADPVVDAAVSGAPASDAQRAAGDVSALQREIALAQKSNDSPQVKQGRLDILNAELDKARTRAGTVSQATATDMKAGMLDLITRAEQEADKTHPGDPVFRDMAVAQVKAHFNNQIANQVAVQQQAHGVLTQIATGTGKGSPRPTTLDDLLTAPGARNAWSTIPPESQRGILAILDQNQKEAMGIAAKSDPATVQDLFARIHADDNDPRKLTYKSQLVPFFGKINQHDYDWLGKEVDQQQSVSGRSLTKDLQNVRTSASSMLSRSVLGSAQPELAAEASYRFSLDTQNQIDAYIKAGKDPRTLLTPGSPDYLLKPERVMSFLQTPQQAVAAQAAAIAKGSRAATGKVGAPAPARVASDAEYAALASGTQFVGPDGKTRTKP